MRLVERHIIKDNRFEEVCHKSGLLYNYVLYNVRQGIFSKNYLKEYDFSTKLNRENQFDFRNLPSSISQQVIAQVFSIIKGWMKGLRNLRKVLQSFTQNPNYRNTKAARNKT